MYNYSIAIRLKLMKTDIQKEYEIQNALLDKILLIFFALILFAVTLSIFRSLNIGFNIYNFLTYFIFILLLILTGFRKKLSVRFKAIFIISICIFAAVTGVLSSGLLAGAIFFFPITILLLSAFSKRQYIIFFIIFSTVFMSIISIGYIFGYLDLAVSADLLMLNPSHWIIYITCLLLFYLIAHQTISGYRRSLRNSLDETKGQRNELASKNLELEEALNKLKTLNGLLPICAKCKKIRDEKGYWNQIEAYIQKHTDAVFSHGLCEQCSDDLYSGEDWYKGMKKT